MNPEKTVGFKGSQHIKAVTLIKSADETKGSIIVVAKLSKEELIKAELFGKEAILGMEGEADRVVKAIETLGSIPGVLLSGIREIDLGETLEEGVAPVAIAFSLRVNQLEMNKNFDEIERDLSEMPVLDMFIAFAICKLKKNGLINSSEANHALGEFQIGQGYTIMLEKHLEGFNEGRGKNG